MKIDLVFPALPPSLDGIGDHTARLATSLHHAGCDVRVWTAQPSYTPIPGVDVRTVFGIDRPRNVRSLADAVCADPPDWLFVQFNQFSYGRYGFNPWLPLTLRRIQHHSPAIRIAWMAHEDFVPAINVKFAVMALWQRWQFRALGHLSDQIFFSIDPWVRRYASWFDAPATHLPVGSNMPRLDLSRPEARSRIGLPQDGFVAGVFGTLAGNARQLGSITAALRSLAADDPSLYVLYVGPHGRQLQDAVPELAVHDAGRLPADDVSVHLSAMDLHLTPFIDGLSTRRGSAMASLQHGVATLSTDGELTDHILRDAAGEAFVLTPAGDREAFVREARALRATPHRRHRIARAGRHLFDTQFSWDAIAARLLQTLDRHALPSYTSAPSIDSSVLPFS